jgi:hypothetical protein
MFQHLVESLLRRVEAVTAAKGGPTPYYWPWFWNEMFDEQVSTYCTFGQISTILFEDHVELSACVFASQINSSSTE